MADPHTDSGQISGEGLEKLRAAGFDDYAISCALRTDENGVFAYAYLYSDQLIRFQTGGHPVTDRRGNTVDCVLTIPLAIATRPTIATIPDGLADRLDAMVSANGKAIVCNGRSTRAMCEDITQAAAALRAHAEENDDD